MLRNKRLFIPFLVFLPIVLANCAYTPPQLRTFPTPETARDGIEEGMRCPNLVFQNEQGQRKELQDYRGKIVFMNFWGSWCIPCQRELPSIQKVYDALKNDSQIAFVLLMTAKDFDASRQYAKSMGYSLPLFKSTPPGGKPMINLLSIPRTLILDRNGIVVMSKTGDENWGFWLERIQDFIRRSAVTTGRNYNFSMDGVQLKAEVMEGKPNSSLRLTLVPEKGVKLSSKKGVIVTPGENNSVKWVTQTPYIRIEEDMDYFPSDPVLSLFFMSSANSGEVNLKIEYGYCKANSEECVPAKMIVKIPIYKTEKLLP